MKIITIFLLCFVCSISASTYAQKNKLSISKENSAILDILKEIEANSEFTFFFNNNQVNAHKRTSVHIKNATLEEALKQILHGTGYEYEIFDRQVLIKASSVKSQTLPEQQQDKRSVQGIIKDEQGESIIGASVIEKGTTNGVVTDIEGKFSLTISDNAILKISYIGYTSKEITIGNQAYYSIVLKEDFKTLEEVVVVAYGTQKKVNLTAAVESVDTKILNNRPVKTVSQMLEGAVPNLNITTSSGAPDAVSSLNIRGFTGMTMDGKDLKSVNGSPLVLVDGVEQDINLINPNDIANISILKDAAASAIYGSRAPYGVILITTKSGEKGKGVSINYSGTYQLNQPSMLPHSATSVDFANYLNASLQNSLQAAVYQPEYIQLMQDYIDGKIDYNNTISPSNGWWREHWEANANTDYIRHAFKNISQNTAHDISISGGTANSSFYAGLGYNHREGIYNTKLDKYERYNGILKLDTDITDWLSFNMSSRYSQAKTLRPNYRDADSGAASDNSFWQNLGYFPNIPIKNPDGSYHRLSAIPILDGMGGKINDKMDDLLLTLGTEVKPFDGFSLKGNFSWNTQSSLYDKNTLKWTVNEPNGQVVASSRSATLDKLYKKSYKSNYYVFDVTANYTKTFGKHDFNILGGVQQELKQNNNLITSATGLYSQSVPSFSTSWGDNKIISDEINEWATLGYFFRMSYNYESRYLLDINGRYDAASKYPKTSRWAFFPSISAGWNIAREKFWFLESISKFKITASFGKSGDQAGGNYLYIPTMSTGMAASGASGTVLNNELPPYVSMPGIVSPKLTWAKPQTLGFGLEIGAFSNRLQAEYYWYQRTTYDQLGPAEILPKVLGTTPPQTNNSVSETRGWDFSISWRDKLLTIGNHPLSYNVRFILSDYIGYVVEYNENISGSRNSWTKGQVFGQIRGYDGTKIAKSPDDLKNNALSGTGWYYQGDLLYKDLNGDGRIDTGIDGTWYSTGDLSLLGYNYPRYKYGVALGLSWKGIDLSLLLDGVGKEARYFNNFSSFGQTGSYVSRYMFDLHSELDYWSLNSQDAFFPRIYSGDKNFGSTNDRYLIDVSHLRVKNLNISYTFPNNISNKIKLNRVSLNVSIENLGMIYYKSWLKLDPQMIRNNGNGYPIQRTFSFGLKVGI